MSWSSTTRRPPRRFTVPITVEDAEESHTDRTVTLAAGKLLDPVNGPKLPLNTDYRVAARVAHGPAETFQWTDPIVERVPLWIRVDDGRTVTFLLQAG